MYRHFYAAINGHIISDAINEHNNDEIYGHIINDVINEHFNDKIYFRIMSDVQGGFEVKGEGCLVEILSI